MVQDSGQENLASAEAEIKQLEQKLEQKKQELVDKGGILPPEKELFREVLRNRIEEVRQTPTDGMGAATVTNSVPSGTAQASAAPKDQQEREEELRYLLEIALSKNIQEAVKLAEKRSPHLLDELHDHLVDDYYQKLIDLRKLKPL